MFRVSAAFKKSLRTFYFLFHPLSKKINIFNHLNSQQPALQPNSGAVHRAACKSHLL
jgi:hypothetical protein